MLSQVLTRKEQLVLLFFGGAICLGSFVLYSVRTPPAVDPNTEMSTPISTNAQQAPTVVPKTADRPAKPVPDPVQVSVAGAVRHPGVYEFEEGARVQEAVDASGGSEPWADLSDVNLAARLIDGTTLTIPGEPEPDPTALRTIRRPSSPPPNPPQYTVSGWREDGHDSAASPIAAAGITAGGLIDLNRAPASELETLPGIGPKLAGEIIRFREQQPFQTVDDLDLVSGIGPKRLEAIRGLVTVAP